jgi:hypothetical protein
MQLYAKSQKEEDGKNEQRAVARGARIAKSKRWNRVGARE